MNEGQLKDPEAHVVKLSRRFFNRGSRFGVLRVIWVLEGCQAGVVQGG